MTLRRPPVLRDIELLLIEPILEILGLGDSDLSGVFKSDTLPGASPLGEFAAVVMVYACGGTQF